MMFQRAIAAISTTTLSPLSHSSSFRADQFIREADRRVAACQAGRVLLVPVFARARRRDTEKNCFRRVVEEP